MNGVRDSVLRKEQRRFLGDDGDVELLNLVVMLEFVQHFDDVLDGAHCDESAFVSTLGGEAATAHFEGTERADDFDRGKSCERGAQRFVL